MSDATITLEASNVKIGVYFRVTFTGSDAERHALAYMDRKGATHAIDEINDEALWVDPLTYPTLYGRLHPQCEHGLSESLCEGPQHYPMDM